MFVDLLSKPFPEIFHPRSASRLVKGEPFGGRHLLLSGDVVVMVNLGENF